MSGADTPQASTVKLTAIESVKIESAAGRGSVSFAFVVGGVPMVTKYVSAEVARQLAQTLDFHATRARR